MRRTLLSIVALLPLAFGACSKVEAGPAAMKTLEAGFTQIQDMIGAVKDSDTAKALADKVTALVPSLKTAMSVVTKLDLTKLTDAMKTQQGTLMSQLTGLGTKMAEKVKEFADKPEISSHLQKAMDAFKQISGS